MSFSLSTQCHMSFTFLNELPSPAEIKQNYPLSDKLKALKKERDAAISAVITGADSRFLVIIGPCSADNEDSVCDYVSRLTSIQEDVADKLILIPRVYTNKPRTTGEGYKGIASQPDPEKAPDMIEGLIAMRKMHIRAIEESGLTCADEMLYPENWGYVEDLLSYVAIGARSVEDQQHRLTVSGFDVASGMKNPTSGDFSVMLNSVYAAQHPHHFVYRGYEVETTGNPLTHVVLRGAVSKHGNTTQNYHYEDLIRLCEMYQEMDRQSGCCGRCQPLQFRQEIQGADPHRKGSHAQQTGFLRYRTHGKRCYDRELYRGRQPENRRSHLWQIHHRPVPWLGGFQRSDLYHCRYVPLTHVLKKNLACGILRARAVRKAICSLPRAAHPRGAFFIS